MAYRKTRTSKRRATTRRASSRRATTRRTAGRRGIAGTPWSKQELAFLRKYYRNNETSWVARQLGRSVYSVRYKASDLNIKKAAPSIWKGNKGVTKPARKARGRKATTRRRSASTRRRSTSRRRYASPTRRTGRRTARRRISRRR